MTESSLVNFEFSPIYDSGSSLGREIPEEKIQEFLESEAKMIKYVKNGKSEVKWDASKLNHFELLKKIREKYPEQIKKTVNRVIEKHYWTLKGNIQIKPIINI